MLCVRDSASNRLVLGQYRLFEIDTLSMLLRSFAHGISAIIFLLSVYLCKSNVSAIVMTILSTVTRVYLFLSH